MFEIIDGKIDCESVIDKVYSPKAGAVSSFIGTVRNFTGDRQVEYLVYEAYRSMALKEMEKLVEEVKRNFGIEKIAVVHRLGKVNVGEASIAIAVSAAHRREAIQACRQVIDGFKKTVPIWKKEFMKNGNSEWISNNCKHEEHE